jgi:hypothetical protein
MYLITNLRHTPDWVWSLKMVNRIKTANKGISEFRIYDPAKANEAKVEIKNFYSLDQHPELILFEGTMDKKTFGLHIKEKADTTVDTKAA